MKRTAFLVTLCLISIAPSAPLLGQDKTMAEAWDRLPKAERLFQEGLKEFQAGRSQEAAGDFEKCLRDFPRHAFARYYLANIAYVANDLSRALADMDKAIADLGFMEALNDYGLTQKAKTYDSYKRMMDMEWSAASSCRPRREIESLQGQVADDEKKQALQQEEQKAARARQKAQYFYFRGNIDFRLQRFDEAARDYEQAIAIDPKHANAYNNLAAIYYLAGRHARAWEYLEAAERQGLEDSLNLNLRYQVLQALGRPTDGTLWEEIEAAPGSGLGVVRIAIAFTSRDPLLPPQYGNAYLVFNRETREAVLIDPGAEDPRIDEAVRARGLAVKAILNTHGHFDHADADAAYAALYGAPVFIAAAEDRELRPAGAKTLAGGQAVSPAGFPIEVILVPGHTPGSVGFLAGGVLFSGDTLFKNSIGRTTADSDDRAAKLQAAEIRAIKDEFLVLPDATVVCPGHGRTTTIAAERANNPYLK